MTSTQHSAPHIDRYAVADLTGFATRLLGMAGADAEHAATVAEILVEGDLLGHTTHGLGLLAPYIRDLEAGRMRAAGEPEIISDRGAALTWDGRFLAGPWLVARAIDTAIERIADHPVVTVVIRRSHHIGCLAAYLRRATDRGLVMLLTCSDPSAASVAPFGSVVPRYSPNPLAAGIPTNGDPIMLDISASTTTIGMTARMNRNDKAARLPGPWLVDSEGQASDDPAVLMAATPGAILPLGGLDLGHKGFALGLLVEAMTSALGGYGRADQETQWGASVFVQIIDPGAFGGSERFRRETTGFAETCRNATVPDGKPPVRMPGQRGLALRARQVIEGVELHPDIMPTLTPLAAKYGVEIPRRA
jgi:L-lactate dehydrogenase